MLLSKCGQLFLMKAEVGALGKDTLGCLFFFNDGEAYVVVETSSINTYLFL